MGIKQNECPRCMNPKSFCMCQNLSESKLNDLFGCRIYFEHGYFCLRTETGKLLWDKKASDLDNYIGVSLDDILKEALINYEAL